MTIEKKPKLIQPNVSSDNKVCYLVLHLAVPSNIIPPSCAHLIAARRGAASVGIKLSTIIISSGKNKSNHGIERYLFRFSYFRREDKLASHFADAVLMAASVTFGPFLEGYDDISYFRIPASLIKNRKTISLDELVQIEETRPWEERITEFPVTLIGSSSQFDYYPVELAWKLTPLLFTDDAFFRAFRFIKTSQENFFVRAIPSPKLGKRNRANRVKLCLSQPKITRKAHDSDFSTFTKHCTSFIENDFAPDESGHLWDVGC